MTVGDFARLLYETSAGCSQTRAVAAYRELLERYQERRDPRFVGTARMVPPVVTEEALEELQKIAEVVPEKDPLERFVDALPEESRYGFSPKAFARETLDMEKQLRIDASRMMAASSEREAVEHASRVARSVVQFASRYAQLKRQAVRWLTAARPNGRALRGCYVPSEDDPNIDRILYEDHDRDAGDR